MSLNSPAPHIPYIDPYGVLSLEELGGRPLFITLQTENFPLREWIHPIWRATKANGESADIVIPPLYIDSADALLLLVTIVGSTVESLDQGHAVMSYSIQPREDYQEGYAETRTWCLVGTRNFPGAGINVPVIKEAHDSRFVRADIPDNGASVALAPWQAMQIGDQVTLRWRGFDINGTEYGFDAAWQVAAADLDQPLAMSIPKQEFNFISGGRGELSYLVDYVGGGTTTVSPVQHFQIVAAPASRLPPLSVVEQVGSTLDPSLLPDTLTFRIAPYADVREGDVLVIYAQQNTSTMADDDAGGSLLAADLPVAIPITSVRLDRSTVDSGLLECTGPSEWLFDYLDSQISLTYHLARPGMALASEPLTLPVRLAMVLPPPIVEGASGAGTGIGEFKAETTGEGIRVWIPSLAVYPAGAVVQMHWEGAGSNGSLVVAVPTGDIPPAYMIVPHAVAPNLGKTVRVFYRVTPSTGVPQDSEVFSLKVLPVPERFYPAVQCEEADAATRTLSLRNLGTAGCALRIARWVLMAVGQRVDLQVTGTLRSSGLAITKDMLTDSEITTADMTYGVAEGLLKSWLEQLQLNSPLTFTFKVTADEGLTYVTFPRLYLTLVA